MSLGRVLIITLPSPLTLTQCPTDSVYEDKYPSQVSLCSSRSYESRPHSFTSSSFYDITSLASMPSSNTTQLKQKPLRKGSDSSEEDLVMMSSVAQLEYPPVQKSKLIAVPSLDPSVSDLSSSTDTLTQPSEYEDGIHKVNSISLHKPGF